MGSEDLKGIREKGFKIFLDIFLFAYNDSIKYYTTHCMY